ncbi:hypothetical protein FIBSPDRAFT_569104 [Athelia psychrophila]|uniref:Uncharacterized protein n=1 Tax=Athelia psychrophila TaxID=1759441 RepID=A0A166HWX9_9AGAM|nr:hypothetical protein FIBSPDRAFT_569104 [Fibularhizoctonia sp. CBS 109695]
MCEVEREAESYAYSHVMCPMANGDTRKWPDYQHPRDHGTIGLMLLGQRGCLQDTRKTTHSLRHSTPSTACHFRISLQ